MEAQGDFPKVTQEAYGRDQESNPEFLSLSA